MMDDNAVSNVLGAVLVTALFFTFLTTVEVEYRPVWDEDEEAEHLNSVVGQFADLKAEVERQTENRTLAPVANPFNLAPPPGTGLLGTKISQGSLELQPATISTTVNSPRIVVVEKDGKPLGILNEDWTLAGTSSEVTQVDRLDSLRLRIIKADNGEDQFQFEKGMFVRLDVTDANGIPAGVFKIYVPAKQKHDIWARVEAASGEVLIDQEIASDVKYKEHTTFWVDTLDPSLPFRQVLDAAEPPFKIELTHDWNTNDAKKQHIVEYSSAYVTKSTQGQDVFVGSGGGATITNYQESHSGASLRFAIEYNHLPRTELILEHGALLIRQPEGTSMILQPHFQVERVGTQTVVNINTPILQGTGDSSAGREMTTVVTQSLRQANILGTAPEFSYRIDTQFPVIWDRFFEERMTDAGFLNPDHYTMTVESDHVIVNIHGTSISPGVDDVQLRVTNSFVNLAVA